MAKLLIPLLSLALLAPAFAEVRVTPDPPASKSCGDYEAPRLSSSVIAAVVRRHFPGIENEYVAALEQEPGLAGGKITVRFTIAADGSVKDFAVIEDTVGCPSLSAAIVERIRAWRFPPISWGEQTVVYPFVFVGPDVPAAGAGPGVGSAIDPFRENAEAGCEGASTYGEYELEPVIIESRLERSTAFILKRRKPTWTFNEDELNGLDGETRAFLVDAAAFLAEGAPDPAASLLRERAGRYAELREIEAEGRLLALTDERLVLGTADTVEMLPAANGEETKAAREHREAKEELAARRDKCRREIDDVNGRIDVLREERAVVRDVRRDELIGEGERLMNGGAAGDGTPWVLLALGELYFERSTAAHVEAVREYRERLTAAWAEGEVFVEREPKADFEPTVAAYQHIALDFREFPLSDVAYYTLAYCLYASNEYEEAARTFYKLVEQYPESEYAAEAYFRVGEYFFDQYEFDKAVKYYALVPPQDPAFGAAAAYKHAWSIYNMGDLEGEARDEYVTAINEFTSYLDRYGPSAQLYREARDFAAYALYEWAYAVEDRPADAAVALFDEQFRGGRERDYSPEVLHVLGGAYAGKGDRPGAVAAYEALLRAYPDYEETPRVLASLAACYGKDEETADDAYKARLRLVEDYGPGSAWYEGLTDTHLRRYALARWEGALYEVAVYTNLLGERRSRFGDEEAGDYYRRAADYYKQYLAAFPTNPKAYHVNFYLGEVYYAAGDFAAAALAYEETALNYTDRERYEIDEWDEKFTKEQSLFNAIVARDEIFQKDIKEASWEEEDETAPRAGLGRSLTANEAELVRVCDLFIERYPESTEVPTILSKLGEIYFYVDDYESARATYGRVVDDYEAAPDPDNEHYHDKLYVSATESIAKSYFNEAEFYEEGAAYEDARRRYELANEWYDRTARKAEARKINETLERAKSLAGLTGIKAAEMRGAGVALEEAGAAVPSVLNYDSVEIYPPLRPFKASAVKAKRAEAEGYEAVAATYGPYNPDIRRLALIRAAKAYYEARDWANASRAYLDLIAVYEEYEWSSGGRRHEEAYERAAEGFERRSDWSSAVEIYARAADHAEFKGTAFGRDSLLRAGLMYEQLDDWPEAAAAFERTIEGYPDEARPRLVATYRLARAEEKLGRAEDALGRYKETVAIYKISVSEGIDISGTERFVAESYFKMLEPAFDEYEAIEFVMPQDVMEENLSKKVKQSQNLVAGYTDIVELDITEWSVAAGCRLGDVYYEFAEALLGCEIPRELQPEYWKPLPEGDERKPVLETEYYTFISLLEEQAVPLKEKAAVAYREAVAIAAAEGIDNEWSRKARKRLAVLGASE